MAENLSGVCGPIFLSVILLSGMHDLTHGLVIQKSGFPFEISNQMHGKILGSLSLLPKMMVVDFWSLRLE